MKGTMRSTSFNAGSCRLSVDGLLLPLLIVSILLAMLQAQAEAHGCMVLPNPRGSLTTRSPFILRNVDKNAPVDYHPHFPAGPRSNAAGAGLFSQIKNAGPYGWVPYAPMKRGFRWRSGVCGDSRQGPYEHMKGGKYYYNGKTVATYGQGDVIRIDLAINAHHNGFMELHLCDVSKCQNGEIGEKCFTQGHCVQLERAWVNECQTGYSKRCGPIDRNYPGRWYFPCYDYRDGSGQIKRYGAGATIQYKLPKHVYCEHCVLQWYWSSANTCNPPGVIEYFDGPDRPRGWGRCPGQGGAIGGVARNQRPCGGRRFPEEYLQCADVRILKRGSLTKPTKSPPRKEKPSSPSRPRRRRSGAPKPSPASEPEDSKPANSETDEPVIETEQPEQPESEQPEYDEKEAMKRGYGAVRDIILLEDGVRVSSLNTMRRVKVKPGVKMTIEALTERGVRAVTFSVDGHVVYRDNQAPFYIYTKISEGWKPRLNAWTTITAQADGDTDSVTVFFYE